jgi:hypothetical protein
MDLHAQVKFEAQTVELLHSQCKAPSSNLSTTGGKKKKEQNPKNQFQRNTQTAKGGLTLFLKVFVFWQHWGLN